MASSVQRKRIRKAPAARRAEIVDAAAAVALGEGLECVTLQRIADELDVRPGLISHYFGTAEDLVAEAFGAATGAELDVLLPEERTGGTCTEHLARFFALAAGPEFDRLSRLWINAWHLRGSRPVLNERVLERETAWRTRLESLVREGVARGEFRTDDPYVTTLQIIVVLDGLGAHANTDTSYRPEAVARMAVTVAEQGLGLARGALGPVGSAASE
ncbi:TetR/AcrR family transcriptional regulator [Yinghuangia soli]|uniref:TetR family transcriptional regulator C-terminal domain-containing protein n=1 Tax=Yinghuangia soli TaxID=2908204 RepID=A0AA41Q3U7_9ACTN|nr:TetR family transcriptional regulator C-terminal domain-containing protein [Yinghuangia soli]MCF2531033.1 TetR family transcriptional regulator C-terminal domain-containing protein [Yinghuangia soli]